MGTSAWRADWLLDAGPTAGIKLVSLLSQLVNEQTVRWVGLIRIQMWVEAEQGRTVGAQNRVVAAHVEIDMRVILGGDAPMHFNCFTPIRISGTPLSFLNLYTGVIGYAASPAGSRSC